MVIRRIGIPHIEEKGWQGERAERLREIGQAKGLDILVSKRPEEEVSYLRSDESFQQALDKVIRFGRKPLIAKLRKSIKNGITNSVGNELRANRLGQVLNILNWSEPLETLLEKNVTAIVAPSDREAWMIYGWLASAGLKVPEDISLISFDNDINELSAKVTTVDFGFGYLGYSAAMLFSKALPVEQNRYGNIASRPFVVDRGSVTSLKVR